MLDQFINEDLRGKSGATLMTYRHALQEFSQWLDGCGATLEYFSHTDIHRTALLQAHQRRQAKSR